MPPIVAIPLATVPPVGLANTPVANTLHVKTEIILFEIYFLIVVLLFFIFIPLEFFSYVK